MNDLTPIKLMLIEAGGEFFGVQENFGPGGNIILFNDISNPRATLAMFSSEIVSVESVRQHIEYKRKQFGISVEGNGAAKTGIEGKKIRSLASK